MDPEPHTNAAVCARPSRGQVNLLAPENGGKLIRAPNASWGRIIDGDDDTLVEVSYGEAVFGFKDDRSATFDTFTVLIPGTSSHNIKDFELLAGNESLRRPGGRKRYLGEPPLNLMSSIVSSSSLPPRSVVRASRRVLPIAQPQQACRAFEFLEPRP